MSYPPSPFPPPPPDESGPYPYPDAEAHPGADGYPPQTPPIPEQPAGYQPPQSPQPPPGAYPPPPPPGGAPMPAPTSGGIAKGPWIIGIAITAVVLVCGAASLFFITQLGGKQGDPTDPGKSNTMDESIKEEFDKNSAEFYTVTDAVADKKHELSDGKYYPDNGSGEDNHVEVASDPVYSDADGDGDLDAAMLLEDTGDPGEDNAWKSVQIWLWDDGVQPVKEYATWQWSSVSTDLEVEAGDDKQGFDVKRDAYNDDGDPEAESVDVAVEDGTSVIKHGKERGATETCWTVGEDDVDMTNATSDPLLLPDSSAAKVGGEQDKLIASVGEDWDESTYGGYVIVEISFASGEKGCGWVPYDDYKAEAQ